MTSIPGTAFLRVTGTLAALSDSDRAMLLDRSTASDPLVSARTAEIIARVRSDGDAALLALARELDGVTLAALEVPRDVCRAALAALDPALRAALERAARNIATAHRDQQPFAREIESEPGIVIGRRPDPHACVGVYAPGGRADYPSSVLMGAIPARVAGVREVLLCSPPGADGRPSAVVLAAAEIANVDRVFALGGAGAIAAMAFGTVTVPRVAAIVGPGNAWVAEAKRQLSDRVATDAPAGPSELLVIADDGADPEAVALEMVAQAEHDPRACAVAVAVGADAASRIAAALERAAASAARSEIVREALRSRGAVLVATSLDEALAFAAEYAPEHLMLAIADPEAALPCVRGAGTVFVGLGASVAFGDYASGGNHVLPTGGIARFASGLSALDFVRWTTWQRVSPAAARSLAEDVARIADSERLPGHAAAARAAGERGTTAGPDRTFEDLGDNTNRFGTPPAARRELARLDGGSVTRYPTPYSDDLVAALAEYVGVAAECVVVGCGSDDVLDAAFRSLAAPGDRCAFSEPTFSMIPLLAQSNRLVARPVRFRADGDLDVDALLATDATLCYVCSPNNPTGTPASTAAVERLLARAPGLVIVDEAYAEFTDQNWAARVREYPNLVVVRTLSKAFGLAGLRVGYAIGAPSHVEAITAARGPYKVTVPAERVAAAVVREDLAWMRERAADAVAMRERFVAALLPLGFAPPRSTANFVLIPVADAAAATATFAQAGIVVRGFDQVPGVGDAVRVTMAPWPVLQRVLDALAGVAPCA